MSITNNGDSYARQPRRLPDDLVAAYGAGLRVYLYYSSEMTEDGPLGPFFALSPHAYVVAPKRAVLQATLVRADGSATRYFPDGTPDPARGRQMPSGSGALSYEDPEFVERFPDGSSIRYRAVGADPRKYAIASVRGPEGLSTYRYADGDVSRIELPNGRAVTFKYERHGPVRRLARMRDWRDVETIFGYDENGRFRQVVQNPGFRTSYCVLGRTGWSCQLLADAAGGQLGAVDTDSLSPCRAYDIAPPRCLGAPCTETSVFDSKAYIARCQPGMVQLVILHLDRAAPGPGDSVWHYRPTDDARARAAEFAAFMPGWLRDRQALRAASETGRAEDFTPCWPEGRPRCILENDDLVRIELADGRSVTFEYERPRKGPTRLKAMTDWDGWRIRFRYHSKTEPPPELATDPTGGKAGTTCRLSFNDSGALVEAKVIHPAGGPIRFEILEVETA